MGKDWILEWSDEFDDKQIDTSVWGYEIGKIRNHELQYYTDNEKNAYIENGCLVINGIKEDFKDSEYTSASLNTLGKKSFLYGKIEMRAKLPYGQGIWPAFWTLGVNIPQIGWPKCGEIDIIEMIGGTSEGKSDSRIHANLHYPDKRPPGKGNKFTLENAKFADDFHVIGIIWDEEKVSWYVDDELYYSDSIIGIEAFHKPQYILLNLAIGGDWPGSPDETTVFPQKYYIDYVRYYVQK